MSKGTKHDKEKNRLDLIPTESLREVGRVLTDGAEVYGDYNWKKGIEYSRLYAAALRHLTAFWVGEDRDPESGHDHRAHAIANLMFMMEMSEKWDDRPVSEDCEIPADTELKIEPFLCYAPGYSSGRAHS